MNGSLLRPVLMYVQRSQNHGTGGLIGSSCAQEEAAAFIWPQFNQDRGVKQKALSVYHTSVSISRTQAASAPSSSWGEIIRDHMS